MKTNDSGKRGTVMFVVLSFTFLSTLLAAALLTGSTAQARVSARQLNMEKALFEAEAGLEQAAQYITALKGYLPNVTTVNGTVGEGSFNYTINKIAWRTYTIDSVGTVHGVSRAIHVDRAYSPTFAQYALWMHVNGKIYFIGGEVFNGHVHSNDQLWFSSQNGVGPIFHDIASSAESTYGGSLDNVEFDKGFQLNAEEGQMSDVDFSELKSLATSYGLVLDGQTTISFDGNNMKITNTRKSWDNKVVPIGPDQLIYIQNSTTGASATRGAKLELTGGSVDGRVSIVTESDIEIHNNITYMKDPRVEQSDNALGLISKDDIWVGTDAPDNLEVMAAVLATGQIPNDPGSFGVIDYNHGDTRGALNMFGSIVQDTRGAVGTFNKNGPKTGYYKNYSFDTRFATNAPPYYPVVNNKIKFAGWSEGPAS